MSSILKPAGAYTTGASDVAPRTVKNVTKLDPYLVSFVDGEGRNQTRLTFRLPGTEHFFVVQEKIQGNYVVTDANNWFKREMVKKLDDSKVESV
jgi:hypothetical protein